MSIANCPNCQTQNENNAKYCENCGLKMKKNFETATVVDIIVSFFIPAFGIIIGLFALCKGETKRAGIMVAISIGSILITRCMIYR